MSSRERSRVVDAALRSLPSLAVFVVGLVVWEVWVNVRDVPAYLYPSASEVGSELLAEGPSLAADDLRWTMIEAVLGFLLGSFAAVLTAIVFVHARAYIPWAKFGLSEVDRSSHERALSRSDSSQ